MLSLFCLLSERGYAKEKLYTGQAEKEGVLEKEYQEPCLYIGCGACISDTGMYLCSIYHTSGVSGAISATEFLYGRMRFYNCTSEEEDSNIINFTLRYKLIWYVYA